MLKSSFRESVSLARGLYPIPATVAMLAEAPGIRQASAVGVATPKDHQHPTRRALTTDLNIQSQSTLTFNIDQP